MFTDASGPERARELAHRHAGAGRTAPVELLGEGEDHVAHLVGGDLVVRVARRTGASAVSEDAAAQVQREHALLALVTEVSALPVPAPVFVVPEEGALAYRYLAGTPLLQRLPDEGRRLRAATAVAPGLGALLRALQEVPFARVKGLAEVDDTPPSAWLLEAREHAARFAGHIPRAHRRHLDAFLQQAAPADSPRRVFSHNDLGAEHVLVDPKTCAITGVIDWSDAGLVDPALDFGRILRDLGPEALDAALLAHGAPGEDALELRRRAFFFARCGLLEDLAFGLEQDKAAYVRKSQAALAWLLCGP